MVSCLDFAEEMMALHQVGHTLGVSVLITPNFHAKVAGEGIEYSWGIAKSVYRKMPLNSKKGEASFKVLVRKCASTDAQQRLCKSFHDEHKHTSMRTTHFTNTSCGTMVTIILQPSLCLLLNIL